MKAGRKLEKKAPHSRVWNGTLTDDDKVRMAQLVANRSNLTADEANQRVNDVLARIQNAENQAKELADQARKAGASLAIFTFLSMLVGAFVAAAAAALGGLQRPYRLARTP